MLIMEVKLICKTCGKEFVIPHYRAKKAKYCSVECANESKRGIKNAKCDTCGKMFHVKESQIKRYARTLGIFCSRKCLDKAKEKAYSGEGNHQWGLNGELNGSFKGYEVDQINHNNIDIKVYSPKHPFRNKRNRVSKHRLIVEDNYLLFPIDRFVKIEDKFYLKKTFDVHHKDGNHNNNNISNLDVITRSEHSKIHSNQYNLNRDSLGRITGMRKKKIEE